MPQAQRLKCRPAPAQAPARRAWAPILRLAWWKLREWRKSIPSYRPQYRSAPPRWLCPANQLEARVQSSNTGWTSNRFTICPSCKCMERVKATRALARSRPRTRTMVGCSPPSRLARPPPPQETAMLHQPTLCQRPRSTLRSRCKGTAIGASTIHFWSVSSRHLRRTSAVCWAAWASGRGSSSRALLEYSKL